jgi:dolichol-phosphate mannosyltransferase
MDGEHSSGGLMHGERPAAELTGGEHPAEGLTGSEPACEPIGEGSDTARRLGLLSVVAPVYNEEALLEDFYARVCAALDGLRFELVLVDDGSSDASPQLLDRLASGDPRVHVVYLSRNFGHQTALTAGLDHARGDAVVMLDADLQDPPELIPRMLDHWRAGCDVVYAVREHREGESRFKLATARWFYRLFDWLTQVELQHNSGDFRLLDRRALDALLSMRERSRFLRGMTVWVGYRQAAVPYRRDARYAGETKYTPSKMLRFSLDAISSFSHRPLQLATLLGFLISGLAFVAIPVVIVLRILGSYLPGFSSITIAILLLGGIQLIALGIIGEYVGRIYDEVKGRPLYLVRSRLNIPPDEVREPQLPAEARERVRTAERGGPVPEP